MEKKTVQEASIILTYGADDKTKECKVIHKIPNFDQVAEAYKYLYDNDGTLDLVTPGKFIFDVCKIEADPELATNHRLMLSVAQHLTITYCLPINADIKKN